MMEVKRKAASNLKGEEITIRTADADAIFTELAESYVRDAPRIKEARARLLEHKTGALLGGPVNEPTNLRQTDAHLLDNGDDLRTGVGVGVQG